ncbi:hypothetical protein [Streptomyces sulphureus]|uniref:hypothetical protein n=1 Tax=Streptomyces sulphureus TaxID=47758 RepID=UPI0003678D7F|nr:hypothetical protein [Streptomyces sulphureus]
MTAHPKDPKPAYEPSDDLKQAEQEMNDAWDAYERKRHAYRKVIAEELRASGLSQGKMAAHLPYTEETVRDIAREYGVAPKRKPTVKSIKD